MDSILDVMMESMTWTNGEIFETVPRHREVNEMLSKKILKTAKNNPPKK